MARYQLSALKDQTYPSLDEMRKAVQKADKEAEAERDVRPLMAILMRMVEASPLLRGHLLTRRTAVTSYDWDIEPIDSKDEERTREVATRLQTIIHTILNKHTQTPVFGALAIKLAAETIEGKNILRSARIYRPDEVERTGEDLERIAILESTDGGKTITRVYPENPQEWITETDTDTFAQGGILRSLMPHEKLRHETYMEWANANRKIKGIALAKLKEFANDADKAAAKQALTNIAQHGFSLTSDAVDFDFKQMVSYLGAPWFKDFIALLVNDMAIAILGQANTTQLPNSGGSRAALQVLNLIRADIHYADIVRIEQILMPQLLLADFQLNYDKAAIAVPWRFRLRMSEDRDTEKEARTIAEALDAGIPLLKTEVYERINFSVPSDTDVVFQQAAATLPVLSGVVPNGG